MLMVIVVMTMRVVFFMIVIMGMIVLMSLMVMRVVVMTRVGVRFIGVDGFGRRAMFKIRLRCLCRINAGILKDFTLDTVAMTAPTRIAMTRAAAVAAVVGAVFGFFLSFAMSAFVGFDQRLTICHRDLVVVGVDFAEGQETVAIAAILDESRLQ